MSGGSIGQMKLVAVKHGMMDGWSLSRWASHAFISEHVHTARSTIELLGRYRLYKEHRRLVYTARVAFDWIRRTFRGIGRTYIQSYLNEFCYRWNGSPTIGESTADMLLRHCLTTPKRILSLTLAA